MINRFYFIPAIEDKKTAWRQNIPMVKEGKEDRYSTFSKRRLGLYKKVSEPIGEFDADIGIVLFLPTNK